AEVGAVGEVDAAAGDAEGHRLPAGHGHAVLPVLADGGAHVGHGEFHVAVGFGAAVDGSGGDGALRQINGTDGVIGGVAAVRGNAGVLRHRVFLSYAGITRTGSNGQHPLSRCPLSAGSVGAPVG